MAADRRTDPPAATDRRARLEASVAETCAPGSPSREGGPLRIGIVGTGWRAEFFRRAAALLPERFVLTGAVSRTPERGAEITELWGVPTYRTVADMLDADRPELVVTSVPWAVTPGTVIELAEAGVPVLAETPPAPDTEGVRALWERVGATGLVQVAEHSPFLPAHQARAALLESGAIGQVTQVQISSTHMYHAVAVLRRLLGVGHAPLTVVARRLEAPLVDPQDRAGWTGATEPRTAATTLAILDWGDGRSAVYDFTDNQWHNPLRVNRLLVRGSHGEILDDRVTRWLDPGTTLTSPIVRTQAGIEQDMDGFDLAHLTHDGRVLYRNRFEGARLADDDIAVAELLDRCRAWVRGDGAPPYPLAEGSQDHLVALAIQEAATTGQPVRTPTPPWADEPA